MNFNTSHLIKIKNIFAIVSNIFSFFSQFAVSVYYSGEAEY